MGFDERDIRRSMDVYTLDNVYLGVVLDVRPGPRVPDGARVPDEVRQSSEISGELLGPMPTEPVGNRGPINQSARALYGVKSDSKLEIGRGAIKVGKWWGLMGRRMIPMDAVQSVSLERVVLKYRAEEL